MKRKPFTADYSSYLTSHGISDMDTSRLSVCEYKKDEVLFYQGEIIQNMYILCHGTIKVCYTNSAGKTLLFAFYVGSGLLGEIEFLTGELTINTVCAHTDISCIEIPIKFYDTLLRQTPDFLQTLSYGLAKKLARCNLNCALSVLSPLSERLCSYILLVQQDGIFKENLTVVSELLGTSYRHLLRTLNSLCEQKIIKKMKNHGYSCNLPLLEKSCGDYNLQISLL